MSNFLVKRELPICARLKISKAEIIIFRFTVEEKHFIVEVIDNSYLVLFKKFGYHVNALLMPKVFLFYSILFYLVL